MKLVNIVHFSKEQSYVDLTDMKLMRNNSKYHFSSEGVLVNSIMDIHCSTVEGRAEQSRIAVDVRGGAVKTFHFEEVINE